MLAMLLAVVLSTNSTVSYACNGSTAAFQVNYPYLSQNDLVVTSTTAGGVVTTLARVTDFTLSVASTVSTATLTLLAPATSCPNGNTLKIARVVPLTQPLNLTTQTSLDPKVLTTAYDRLMMQVQQTNTGLTAISTTSITSGVLPQVRGGTGAGSLVCGAGQALTSNGTALSCTTVTANGSVQLQAAPSTPQAGVASLTSTSATPTLTLSNDGAGSVISTLGASVFNNAAPGSNSNPAVQVFGNTFHAGLGMTPRTVDPATPSDGEIWTTANGSLKTQLNGSTATVFPPGVTDYFLIGRRLGYTIPIDGAATVLTPVGLPAVVQASGTAQSVWSNDTASDSTRDLVKITMTNAGANTVMNMGSITGTMRQLLPRFSTRVNLGQVRTPGAGTYNLGVGLVASVINNSSSCKTGVVALTGFWVCATDDNSVPGGGVNWVLCVGGGASTTCFDSGIATTVGMHGIVIDLSLVNTQVTYTIDTTSVTKTTAQATFPAVTASMGAMFTLSVPVLSQTISAATAGSQIVQNF